MGMQAGTGRTQLGQTDQRWRVKKGDVVKTSHPDTNLSRLLLWSSLAGPVQELLSEQNRLLILRNTSEQSPAWTPLPPPEDRSKSNLRKLELKIQTLEENRRYSKSTFVLPTFGLVNAGINVCFEAQASGRCCRWNYISAAGRKYSRTLL